MGEDTAIQIRSREELISLLYEAAELEHGLACSYLFAAFSLKGEGSGLTAEQAEAVGRWRKDIVGVAEEEMLHLALVSNLLTSLGAAPHLDRPAFPQQSRYYPAGITVQLRRFDDSTLTRFIFLERPENTDPELEAESDRALTPSTEVPEAPPGALRAPGEDPNEVPSADSFATVGHLYRAIEDGFARLVGERGRADIFIGSPGAQATEADFGFPELVAVTDLASAQRALKVLVIQGEGVQGDWADAHYGTFLRIREELRRLCDDDPSFDPAWPVIGDPVVHEPPGGAPGRVVDDPLTVSVIELFNNAYALMTTMLLRFFARTDESTDAVRTLAETTIGLMTTVIGPLGQHLATMPAGPSHGSATAGPSFEIHRPVVLAPYRRAAWLVFHERLVELASFADQVSDQGGPSLLAGVSAHLRAMARQLEQHLE